MCAAVVKDCKSSYDGYSRHAEDDFCNAESEDVVVVSGKKKVNWGYNLKNSVLISSTTAGFGEKMKAHRSCSNEPSSKERGGRVE